MKRYIGIFLLLFYSFTQSQTTNEILTGKWVSNLNNQKFEITIYEEGDILKGDYQLYETDENGSKKPIYKSNKLINKEFGMYFGHAFYGNINDENIFIGVIKDNILLGDKIHSVKVGELLISIKDTNHITWTVSAIETYNRRKNLKTPDKFSIPTNIKLTRLIK